MLIRLLLLELKIRRIGRRVGERGLAWAYILHDFWAPIGGIRSGAGQPHPAQQENMEIEQYIVSTDQQLVERALDGDTVAFEHLFNRYRDSIYQLYVQRTSGRTDDASDLLQETFVKVYLNMQRYDSRYTFGQWVYTIARNTFIDHMRRKLASVRSTGSASASPRLGEVPRPKSG